MVRKRGCHDSGIDENGEEAQFMFQHFITRNGPGGRRMNSEQKRMTGWWSMAKSQTSVGVEGMVLREYGVLEIHRRHHE